MKLLELARKPPKDRRKDVVCGGPVVGVGGEVSGLDHLHPGFAIINQPALEGGTGRVAGADQADNALILQVVLKDIPGQFVGVFKALNGALLFQFGKGARAGQIDRLLEFQKNLAEVVETLFPADIGVNGSLSAT